MTTIQLRDYQQAAIEDTYQAISENRSRLLLFAPTGSGKSILIAKLIQDFLGQNKRILVLAHRAKLINQLSGTIKTVCNGQDSSFIMPGKKFNNDLPVQLGMVQSLATRDIPTDIDVLLIDETHVSTSFKGLRRTLDHVLGGIWSISKKPVIGFTATPWRTKKKEGLCWLFDYVIKVSSVSELVQAGHLTEPRIYTYDTGDHFENTKVDKTTDDFNIKEVIKNCTEEYNNDVIDKWRNHNDKAKTIWFCAGVVQADYFQERLTKLGYKCATVTGKDTNGQRDVAFTAFDNNEIQILISINTLTEGYDQPDIECVVIARPTRSPALFSQMAGRGLRLFEGKLYVDIIDCGGCARWLINKKFHGEVIHEVLNIVGVRLCPTNKPEQKFPTKQCPHCNAELRAVALVCHECGAQLQSKEKVEKITMAFFPKLVQLTVENRELVKEYTFIRKFMMKSFSNQVDPNLITQKFFAKFKKLPDKRFFTGSIFKGETADLYQSIYSYYLAVYLGDKDLYSHYMNLEFADAAKKIKPFSPSQYLGLEGYTAATLSFDVLDEAYTKMINSTQHSAIVNFAYKEVARKLE